METYNGWKNRQTWNVSLWINNDEYLYNLAVKFMNDSQIPDYRKTYKRFIICSGLAEDRTPDNIKFLGTRLDYKALNEMMKEMVN